MEARDTEEGVRDGVHSTRYRVVMVQDRRRQCWRVRDKKGQGKKNEGRGRGGGRRTTKLAVFWGRRSLGRSWTIGELANPERGRTGIEDTKKRSNKTVTASDCVQNRLQPPFRTRKLTICPLLSTAALVLLSEVEAIAVPCWAANRRRSMMSQGHFSVAGPIRRGAGGA